LAGPIILLDKSTFQALSSIELDALYKHYFVNICPILLIEILCDLIDKNDTSITHSEKVQKLANKLNHYSSAVNVDHRLLMIESLLGNHPQMSNRPIVGNSHIISHDTGHKGIVFLPTKENFDIKRWCAGEFTEEEIETAKIWKTNYAIYDLNEFITQFRKNNTNVIIKFDDVDQIKQFVDVKINDPDYQYVNLQHFMHTQDIELDVISKINNRWIESNSTDFSTFCPFAFYCYRTDLTFRLSLISNVIGAKATNFIDLQYLYYLPFCQVFSSGDTVHSILAPTLLENHQTFVSRDVLKSDLGSLSNWWSELTPKGKKDWVRKFGHRPPPDTDSITFHLWEKYFGPWSPLEGNKSHDMTEAEKMEEIDMINSMTYRAFEELKKRGEISEEII
jgi:hypothetical protein